MRFASSVASCGVLQRAQPAFARASAGICFSCLAAALAVAAAADVFNTEAPHLQTKATSSAQGAWRDPAALAGYACAVVFAPFFDCVEAYYDGHDVSDRGFASTIRDLAATVTVEGNENPFCVQAFALAQALTAEFHYILAQPLVELLHDPERQGYLTIVRHASDRHVRTALQLALVQGFGMKQVPRLAALVRLGLARALLAGQPAPTWAAAGTAARAQAFTAAVEDHTFNEVWFPLIPSGRHASFWRVPSLHAAAQEMDNVLARPVEEWAAMQEAALRDGLESALHVLEVARAEGAVIDFWPIHSTLIALLRYGRLFGEVSSSPVRLDCVDDDLDFAMALPSEESWAGFALWAAVSPTGFSAAGWHCSLGGNATQLAEGGSYSQLLCTRHIRGWLVPLSMHRELIGGNGVGLVTAACSAYDMVVPCPVDIVDRLAAYPGCVALPDISLASLTVGNDCIKWMSRGLLPAEIGSLIGQWLSLRERGFLTMLDIWERSEDCLRVDVTKQVSVGVLGASLQSFYRRPSPREASCQATAPPGCGVGEWLRDDPRCRQRGSAEQPGS